MNLKFICCCLRNSEYLKDIKLFAFVYLAQQFCDIFYFKSRRVYKISFYHNFIKLSSSLLSSMAIWSHSEFWQWRGGKTGWWNFPYIKLIIISFIVKIIWFLFFLWVTIVRSIDHNSRRKFCYRWKCLRISFMTRQETKFLIFYRIVET